MRLARREVFFSPAPQSEKRVKRRVEPYKPGAILVGALLVLALPFGLALLWRSGRCEGYGRDARVALTIVSLVAFALEVTVLFVLGR